jgi:hypothetical protein
MSVVRMYWSTDFVALPAPLGLPVAHHVQVPLALEEEAVATPGMTGACERALATVGVGSPDMTGGSGTTPLRRALAFIDTNASDVV